MEEGNKEEKEVEIITKSEKIMDTIVHFQVMKFTDSFFVWVSMDNKLSNLHIAFHQPVCYHFSRIN